MAASQTGTREGRGFYRWRSWLGRWSALAVVIALAMAPSCQTVAVTGRKQLNIFSLTDDRQLGAKAYAQAMSESKLVRSGPQYDQVKRVCERLIPVVDDPGFEWEFNVIDDPQTVNAWCMPGGKIAVYTGILPVTEDDAGLAVVLGHEIAHAIARHGTERMTTQGLGDTGLSIIANQFEEVARYQEAVWMATDLLVYRPWGREKELEADHIGLIYMARAGYDPRTSVQFWQRMSAAAGGGAPPEFLSTHPSDSRRIEELQELMPEALAIYQAAAPAKP